jgi:hypothetical protein
MTPWLLLARGHAPIVDGDQAAVPWSAPTRLTDGGTEDLAGVSLLRFGADGLSRWDEQVSHHDVAVDLLLRTT